MENQSCGRAPPHIQSIHENFQNLEITENITKIYLINLCALTIDFGTSWMLHYRRKRNRNPATQQKGEFT